MCEKFYTLSFFIMFARNFTPETMFSNFLSFNFGLLVTSLYALYFALSSKVENEGRPSFLIIFTVFWIVFIDTTYVIYPDIPNVGLSKVFEKYLVHIAIIILGVTIYISLLLNKTSIERSINESKAARRMEESDNIKEDSKGIFQELEMDGIQ